MSCGLHRLVNMGALTSHPATRENRVQSGMKFSFDRDGRND